MKKSILFTITCLIITINAVAQSGDREFNQTIIKEGVGLGSVIAVVLSWDRNKSILWAILHGIFSWFYVIYFAITRKPAE